MKLQDLKITVALLHKLLQDPQPGLSIWMEVVGEQLDKLAQAKKLSIDTTEGLTDEYIRNNACMTKGCINWAAHGVVLCEFCIHGAPRRMSEAVGKRKLQIEADQL